MSRHPELNQWIGIVCSHFPRLSKPLATGLALWSFGMIVARSCGLTAVAGILAPLLGQQLNTVRERLRDTYREADAKAGPCRSELEVTECWAPWLAWVLKGWSGQQLAIAIDATTLGQRFVVLAISVVYRGCAVPVAWKILWATEKHPWQPEWLALLERFRDVVPAGWMVIVLADRGLYAKWLFQAIRALGWHPLLRVNQQGTFRREALVSLGALHATGSRGRPALGRPRHGLPGQAHAVGVHPVGLLGCGAPGGVAVADRPATASCERLLVRIARLDRARLQAHQARWLAMAIHPHGGSGAGGAAVAGSCFGDLVAAVGRRRGRSSPASGDVAACAWCRPAPGKGLALDRCLPPRMEPDHGGSAYASTLTDGAWRPGTLAGPTRR